LSALCENLAGGFKVVREDGLGCGDRQQQASERAGGQAGGRPQAAARGRREGGTQNETDKRTWSRRKRAGRQALSTKVPLPLPFVAVDAHVAAAAALAAAAMQRSGKID
jgi:hypothetical protein